MIWNSGAAGLHGIREATAPVHGLGAGPGGPGAPPADAGLRAAAEFAREGPPSVFQRYLIGKRLDINSAHESEIAQLPGISLTVAAAVVAERRRRGGFRAPEELLLVKGIKERRLKIILPFLAPMENN